MTKTTHRTTALAAVILLACQVAVASAATFYPISGVTSDTAGTDFFPASRLIEGAGTGFDAAPPHNRTSGLTWVTAASGADYFTPLPSPAPRLVFDLGQNVGLSEISVWGYADTNSNGANLFSLQFATDAEGTGGFGTSITYNPTFAPTLLVTPRQSFAFAQGVNARYVEFTPLDNFFGVPGPPGGDRVGLGEVAFATPEPSTCALVLLGAMSLFMRRRRRR